MDETPSHLAQSCSREAADSGGMCRATTAYDPWREAYHPFDKERSDKLADVIAIAGIRATRGCRVSRITKSNSTEITPRSLPSHAKNIVFEPGAPAEFRRARA